MDGMNAALSESTSRVCSNGDLGYMAGPVAVPEVFVKQAKVLTDLEFEQVLTTVAQGRYANRNRAAIMLSHLAGMRVGEIAELTISDVLDSQGRVRDRISLPGMTTRSAYTRAVPLNSRLRLELYRYIATLYGRESSRPLLWTQKRTPFSASSLCDLFSRIYVNAGIDGATSHSGRRWFISRLAQSGVSAKVIMTLAGHKHPSTTRRYIEVNDETMRRAVEVLR